jgi:hypothetical protein
MSKITSRYMVQDVHSVCVYIYILIDEIVNQYKQQNKVYCLSRKATKKATMGDPYHCQGKDLIRSINLWESCQSSQIGGSGPISWYCS